VRRPGTPNQAIYVISVAAELAGVHPQTLRVYERKGLLSPARTAGNTRRYSPRDIERLRKIQELTQEGINLAGVMRILGLEQRLETIEGELRAALEQVERSEARLEELLQARQGLSLVPLRDVRRVRRAMRSDAIDRAGRRRVFPAPPVAGPDEEMRDEWT
jgi:MerR family transcriptional regulator, heat shock protein HspR